MTRTGQGASRRTGVAVLALALTLAAPAGVPAQSRAADSLAVLAVADSALAAITRSDAVALTDLMLPETRIQSAGMRQGRFAYGARTREQERARGWNGRITERGFGASAQVSGPLAVVWMPYDLYVDGAWSHCGVDAFTLLQVDGRWRIASLVYSVEQPPACARHPEGPPR